VISAGMKLLCLLSLQFVHVLVGGGHFLRSCASAFGLEAMSEYK